jgi:hypothetical protein
MQVSVVSGKLINACRILPHLIQVSRFVCFPERIDSRLLFGEPLRDEHQGFLSRDGLYAQRLQARITHLD